MSMLCVFVVYVVLFSNAYSYAYKDILYEGSACTVNKKPGICRRLYECPAEDERVRRGGQARVPCSFIDKYLLVCCEMQDVRDLTAELLFDMRSGTEEVPTCIFNGKLPLRCCPSIQVYIPALQDADCPQLPRLQKTGNFVKDKCFEYTAFARPCVRRRNGTLERPNIRTVEELDPRITNGVEAKFAEFPHMVLLGYQSSGTRNREVVWMNGGTLISETFVLTAAHLIIIGRQKQVVQQVCVGLLKSSKACLKQTLYRVKNTISHSDYEDAKFYDDIALLELEKPVILNLYVRPACLPFTTYNRPIPTMIVAGWGYTTGTATDISDHLMKTMLKEFNTSVCEAYAANKVRWDRGWLPDKLLCAGSDSTSDSCGGDSGGPLMTITSDIKPMDCSYEVVGIVSAGGHTCGIPGQPAIYTRVSGYIDWIVRRVWPNKV